MLSALKDGDSRDQLPVPVSSRLPTGTCAWFSLHEIPLWGFLRWRANPYPRRSHVLSAGVTSPVPLVELLHPNASVLDGDSWLTCRTREEGPYGTTGS